MTIARNNRMKGWKCGARHDACKPENEWCEAISYYRLDFLPAADKVCFILYQDKMKIINKKTQIKTIQHCHNLGSPRFI